MRPFSSLFTKILLWFFINLALVSAVLIAFFSLESRIDLNTFLGLQTFDRMRIVGSLIAHDLNEGPKISWSSVLAKYSKIYQVNFVLLLGSRKLIRSSNMNVSDAAMKQVSDAFRWRPPPDRPPPPFSPEPQNPPIMNGGPPFPGPEPPGRPRLIMRTKDPTRYWAGIPIPLFSKPPDPPMHAVLLAVSDSVTGHGFFFDPYPVIIAAASVILISVLFWIPLVRNITRPLARMTLAAEDIAKGRFDVRIEESRSDEIGRLSSAINHMTSRLHGFVKGRKRFLGDAAHELGSPIARIHFGLGILEQHVDSDSQKLVADVVEDVTHLSKLVNELLSFSRVEMSPAKVKLETTELLPLVERVVQRESMPETEVIVRVDPGIKVVADPELLSRGLANLLRNAVKYAGDAGPIHISAWKRKSTVMMKVWDVGPGVPEDLVEQLFEPFFRPEASRNRDSGGVGLGLAIVKTCIETCKGTVSAQNLKPKGFAVTITLPA